jgi:hypothetical protein
MMPVLTFQDLNHRYELDGQHVWSVTQVLSRSGLVDFSRVPQPIMFAARDRGSAVHRAGHFWLENDLDVDQFETDFPEYAGYLRSLIALFDSGRLNTVACERRVASVQYQYAGTFDFLGTLDGKAALLDLATGSPADCAKNLQLSAYEHAAREWAHLGEDPLLAEFFAKHKRVQRIAVRLMKDGSLPKLETYTDPREFSEFRTLLQAQQIVAKYKGSWIHVEAA